MTASQQLRTRTNARHEEVDAAFGGADLADRAGYAALLRAHARALLPAEEALAHWPGLPAWRPRAALLAADLRALGTAPPPPLPFALTEEAAAWGALYVLEGSRLGNAMLSRQVGEGLPLAYMNARHEGGGWRTLLGAIDAEGARREGEWLDRAVAGAEDTFALYLAAARPG